jgi:hypothetical protein
MVVNKKECTLLYNVDFQLTKECFDEYLKEAFKTRTQCADNIIMINKREIRDCFRKKNIPFGMSIYTDIFISNKSNMNYKLSALWDTGASTTGISQKIASFIGAEIYGYETTFSVNGEKPTPYTFINILMPDKKYKALKVFINNTTVDVLIGLDIINCGNFILRKTRKGAVNFSFTL